MATLQLPVSNSLFHKFGKSHFHRRSMTPDMRSSVIDTAPWRPPLSPLPPTDWAGCLAAAGRTTGSSERRTWLS